MAPAPGGDWPFAVAFSSDGQRVAVGYSDSARVDVLSGDDLSLLWSADSSGANGDLNQVAWSADTLDEAEALAQADAARAGG